MAPKKSDYSKSSRKTVPYIAIPKPWLFSIIAVLIIPWLTVTAIWLNPLSFIGFGNTLPVTTASAGKWGELNLVPIVISPPMELVPTDWGFTRQPIWFFPGTNAEMAIRMLQTAGISAADAAKLRQKAQFEPKIDGVVFTPDPAWVRTLSKQIRAQIYKILVKSDLNVNQTQAFKFFGKSPEEWFGQDLISSHTKYLVKPLIYRDGDYMLFSDMELIRAEIGEEEEIRRLCKTLSRQPTLIAHLSVGPEADLDELVEYWGRGGRRTEIRPLLESVAGGGYDQSIDIIYLLPTLAQNYLYTYPELSAADLDRPAIFNCL